VCDAAFVILGVSDAQVRSQRSRTGVLVHPMCPLCMIFQTELVCYGNKPMNSGLCPKQNDAISRALPVHAHQTPPPAAALAFQCCFTHLTYHAHLGATPMQCSGHERSLRYRAASCIIQLTKHKTRF
jgi:hypothetical protein